MVKTLSEVREKMTERVGSAGKYLKAGMAAAEDPLDVLTRNAAETQKKWEEGIKEASRKGNLAAGLKKAKENDSWRKSQDRAGNHFEERKEDMVNNAMKDYEARAKVIEAAQNAVSKMPTSTRDQRIAKSAAYQKAVGAGMDALYGRKA